MMICFRKNTSIALLALGLNASAIAQGLSELNSEIEDKKEERLTYLDYEDELTESIWKDPDWIPGLAADVGILSAIFVKQIKSKLFTFRSPVVQARNSAILAGEYASAQKYKTVLDLIESVEEAAIKLQQAEVLAQNSDIAAWIKLQPLDRQKLLKSHIPDFATALKNPQHPLPRPEYWRSELMKRFYKLKPPLTGVDDALLKEIKASQVLIDDLTRNDIAFRRAFEKLPSFDRIKFSLNLKINNPRTVLALTLEHFGIASFTSRINPDGLDIIKQTDIFKTRLPNSAAWVKQAKWMKRIGISSLLIATPFLIRAWMKHKQNETDQIYKMESKNEDILAASAKLDEQRDKLLFHKIDLLKTFLKTWRSKQLNDKNFRSFHLELDENDPIVLSVFKEAFAGASDEIRNSDISSDAETGSLSHFFFKSYISKVMFYLLNAEGSLQADTLARLKQATDSNPEYLDELADDLAFIMGDLP